MEMAEQLANMYPVEPLALNLKHTNRVGSSVLNKSREQSTLSKSYQKSFQSVALDLSKPPINSGEALDLSSTKLPSFREGEVTAYRSHQREDTPSSNHHRNHSYDHSNFRKRCPIDLGKAVADDMIKQGKFLVENSLETDNVQSSQDSNNEDENQLAIDCSNSHNFSNEETNFEKSHKDRLESNSVTNSQFQYGKDLTQDHNRGHSQCNQGHNNLVQGQQSESQGQVPSTQSQGLASSQGQSLTAGAEAWRFNGLLFPFNLQQHLMMMNGSLTSPPMTLNCLVPFYSGDH